MYSEKETPGWLQPVWLEAERELSAAEYWIVCGYSLPVYDVAMRRMLSRAVVTSRKTILLLDPASLELKGKWQEIAPVAQIACLPGLPDGTNELAKCL